MTATDLLAGILSTTRLEFYIQVYRGEKDQSQENSLAAFAPTLTIGATTLELDASASRHVIGGATYPQVRC